MVRLVKTLLPALLLPLVLSCQGDGLQQAPGYLQFTVPEALTKGSPQAVMYGLFSCWGYVYEDEPSTPTYLCGEPFVRVGGDTFRSSGLHTGIPEGYRLRFWALAPVDAAGLGELPSASSPWPPAFRMRVPSSPGDQMDVVAALSGVYEGSSGGAYALMFRHLMSCVQFRTSVSGVPECRVEWIEVSGVKEEGVYTEGSGWSAQASSAAYRVSSGRNLTAASNDILLHDRDDSLMLIPQLLGTDALLRVGLDIGGTRVQRTASLEGLELEEGCLHVIRLSIPATGSLSLEISVAPWLSGPGFTEKSGIPEGTPLAR